VVRVGTTIQLTATARSAGTVVGGRAVSWSSSRTDLAEVAADGLVTGVAPGQATITATVEGVSGTLQVAVTLKPVASVSVNAPAASVAAGSTLQLAAVAHDSAGAPLSGRAVAWQSDHPGLATVSGTGLLSAAAPGAVKVTATVEGVQGSLSLTVTPVPVATVAVVPDTGTLAPGQSRGFAAVARDAGGGVLTGRPVEWSSASPGVATVTPGGVVTGVAGGSAAIVATVEGKTGAAHVTVVPQVAARVAVSPRVAVADVGAPVTIRAAAYTAAGDSIFLPQLTWTAAAGAAVTQQGVVTASQPGAFRVAATAGAAADTAVVAALGPSSLLATAYPGGSAVASVAAGASFDLPVALDLSRVSASGDLGSLEVNLLYDPSVLVFDGFTPVAHGALDLFSPSAGTVRIAFAETSPQGSGAFTLAVLRFHVAAGAAPGARAAFSLAFTAPPHSTGFQPYAVPVAVGGSVRVVP
jgi:uncharacterized protein YjdB